jgi:serine/threonine protein kinase/WD40 repeat protein
MLAPGARVGAYRLLEKLGQGGMGVVFKAQDERLGRLVAVKVASSLLAGDEVLGKRFAREARAAAAVHSAHVASIIDVGEHQGLPFIVLEYLPGGSLRDAVKREGPLPWPRVAECGVQIARGLQAIHAAGLVHRDLKPDNVLLDASGVCKITDFGLVGVTDEAGITLTSRLTNTGDVMGTLSFMAPEQADGKRAGPDADVYALGATLYYLLTGRAPFQGEGLSLLKRILVDAPPPLEQLAPATPAGLAAVVNGMLSKSPGARGDAARAAADLASVTARPAVETPARRSPWRVGVALVVAASVAGVGLALRLGSRETPRDTDAAAPSTATVTAPADSRLDPVSRDAAKDFLASKTGALHLEELWGSYDRRYPHHATKVAFSPDGARVAVAGGDPAVIVYDARTGRDSLILRGRAEPGFGVAWKGERIAAISNDGNVYVWNLASPNDAPTRVAIAPGTIVGCVDLSPDGHAIACSGKTVRAWNLATGEDTFKWEYETPVKAVRFSRSGRLAAVADVGGTVRIWNVEKRAEDGDAFYLPVGTWKDRTIQSVSFSLSEQRLLVSGVGSDGDSPIFVFDLAHRQVERVLRGHTAAVCEVSCSPESPELAASASYDETVRLWNIETGACLDTGILTDNVLGVDWSKDGRALATAGYDFAWWLWKMERGKLLGVEPSDGGHVHMVRSVHFGRESGRRVVSGSHDHTVKVWRLDRREPEVTFSGPGQCCGAVILGADRGVFAAFMERGAQLWPLDDRRFPQRSVVTGQRVFSVSGTADGSFAFTGGAQGDVVRWRLTSAGLEADGRLSVGHGTWVLGTDPTPDGQTLLVGCESLDLWHVIDPASTQLGTSGDAFASVALAGDDRALTGGRKDGAVLLWDVASRRVLETLDHHGSCADFVCVSANKNHALSGGADGRVCLWDLTRPEGRKLVDTLDFRSRADRPTCGEFAPDGRSCVIGTARGIVLRYAIRAL